MQNDKVIIDKSMQEVTTSKATKSSKRIISVYLENEIIEWIDEQSVKDNRLRNAWIALQFKKMMMENS